MFTETPNGEFEATEPGSKKPLHGRIALVTGAAGGLGSALAGVLAERGALVIASDVDLEAVKRVARSTDGRIVPLHLNLAEPQSIVHGVETIAQAYERIDILVHAAVRHYAGDDGHELRPFTEHTVDQVLETLAVSVTGPTLLTQLITQGMVERRSGCIVFTGSMHRSGTAGIVMYSAAKAFVNALARGLFLELREYNVRTLVANPGGMHTALHGHRYPWMLDPAVVANLIADQIALPEHVAVLSFEIVPHDPEHPDAF